MWVSETGGGALGTFERTCKGLRKGCNTELFKIDSAVLAPSSPLWRSAGPRDCWAQKEGDLVFVAEPGLARQTSGGVDPTTTLILLESSLASWRRTHRTIIAGLSFIQK